jgi:hypothetical protein
LEELKMTRFEKEIRGELGAYWKTQAENEVEKMNVEVAKGLITIDDDGVARNAIGRVLMEDQMEILSFTNCKFSKEATRKAREDEVAKSVASYKKNARTSSFEEMSEMRNAFGAGTKAVDALSGKTIQL